MKNRLFSVLLTSTLMLVFQGCAHSRVGERLNEKLANEPAGETRAQLSADADLKVAQDKELTDAQKSLLKRLGDETRTKIASMREEGVKLRMILVKDLVAADTDYDASEVDLVKKRIRDVEQAKLSEFFRAVREANVIMGRWASRNERNATEYDTDFYNQLMMPSF